MRCVYQVLACVSMIAAANADETQERFNDMKRDEFESTDSLAIPLDSSELELDEELKDLERIEKQNQHHNSK